ncbi:MAG: hypothetical protein ACHQ53_09045 [Polyangiales bacterium]
MQKPCAQSESLLQVAPRAPAITGVADCAGVEAAGGIWDAGCDVCTGCAGCVDFLGCRNVESFGNCGDCDDCAWQVPETQAIPPAAQGSTPAVTSQRIGKPFVSTIALQPKQATSNSQHLERTPLRTRPHFYRSQRGGQRNNASPDPSESLPHPSR